MIPPILQVESYGKNFMLHEQNKLIPSSHNVSFTVRRGNLTALIGPTGAGKSTVLKGIYRTYLPSAGRILYRDAMGHELDLALASEHQILELRRCEIGFVTQFLHCLPRQATLDVVAQPLFGFGVARTEARQRAAELLSAMKLPERLWSVSPATFSGGERQRVNLARGFIAKPRLLLLDEPTASLDPTTAECVLDLIEELKAEGTAMLAIFHHPETTRRLADQVVELAPPPAVEERLKELA
ncbi:MAG: phosphonate C-P lyase system protein PhnL [Betaproteobacteria bacterium HGW-Betaproteobacteria-17]|jgi:alpha-D-ribose 1-methylphosphonate 5-triphosphate synthase subunit PhnL|nr:MAG: phosphonate C-P lyase system protein PhnL [Betaproteobacteria bacterium HGW-Betaproteobacteria-17]